MTISANKRIELTKNLIEKLKEKFDIPGDSCLQLIMLCIAFDVGSMDLSELKGRSKEAVDFLINDDDFNGLIEELKKELENKNV